MKTTGKKTEYSIDAWGNIINDRYQLPTGLHIDDNSEVIDSFGFPTGYHLKGDGKFENRLGLSTGLMSNLQGHIYRELASATPEQDNYYRSRDLSMGFFSGGGTEPNPGRAGHYYDVNAVMRR
jgi:hypothetical protein